ncbi:hypothetical protein SAMN06264364_102257 [Quadrisphaera granulorum]|uniref:Uncharacterized protein n=1 Tax=Quadrisphaera granulorum TaxID=317664 RepID=A0A316AEU7_9ACTN|nr:hypothetical protein [Quadrisphaera granulorum]PWJ55889.1 hypothetical protein BXY45_102257 [Quadrisphaera granulorum]SZE95386.1 hypothetical protein SAMN06264364_102257 [Quadrisphaera granulorum]
MTDDSVVELDDQDDDGDAEVRPGDSGRDPRRHRGRVAVAGAVLAVAVVVVLVRHEDQREQLRVAALEVDRAARAAAEVTVWQEQQRRSREHRLREVEALALLPEDLAFQQRLMTAALAGAAPRLPDLDWSRATTRTVRTTEQRLGDGSPRLLDAERTARPTSVDRDDGDGDDEEDDGDGALPVPAVAGTRVVGLSEGAGASATVVWRITTPLTAPAVTDPCAVPGAVPVPAVDSESGDPPECALRTVTSPSGEEQVVALRTWQETLGGPHSPGFGAPVRVITVHQAVLVVEQRWTFSVAATAVGAPGTAASVPPLSLDQASLAVRWAADEARGRPTPAPLRGTPLPGFAG